LEDPVVAGLFKKKNYNVNSSVNCTPHHRGNKTKDDERGWTFNTRGWKEKRIKKGFWLGKL